MDTTQQGQADAVEAAFKRAAGSWTGWDWAHDFAATAEGGQDVVVVLDGRGDIPAEIARQVARQVADVAARADVAERLLRRVLAYRRVVHADALVAEEDGVRAISAYRAGNLDGALDFARGAARREREYGDAPTWGPLVATMEAAVVLCIGCGERIREADATHLPGEPGTYSGPPWFCAECVRRAKAGE